MEEVMKILPVLAASALLGSVGVASAYPTRVLVPCQYPHGWNSTDASRELRGIPNGMDHQCLVDYDRYRVHPGWSWRSFY
jgi:hypothetical protein